MTTLQEAVRGARVRISAEYRALNPTLPEFGVVASTAGRRPRDDDRVGVRPDGRKGVKYISARHLTIVGGFDAATWGEAAERLSSETVES